MRKYIVILVISALCIITTIASLCIGENGIPLSKLFSFNELQPDSVEYIILTQIRLPRTFIALAIGAMLGASGIIMQAIFRNPLVEPYTLGTSGGALLGVATCITFGLSGIFSGNGMTFFAILGSLASIIVVSPIRKRNTSLSSNKILLLGIMFSFVASALTTLLLSISTREQMSSIITWSIGGFSSITPYSATLCSVIAIVTLILSPFMGNLLNILLLGETTAHTLGIRTRFYIPLMLSIAAILAAIEVASAGIIAFIGMIIPHFSRQIIGYDHRIALPLGMVMGGTIMLCCDIIAREIIYPQELPVGVITGLLGGVIFIWINHHSK
ncbi:MAG: iron ABC transporter permease [Bacteroidia bacterium]|nr:iron ABC transporter permease [Bacteroidia bacterium]